MEIFGTTSTGEAVHKLTFGAGDLTVSVLTWGAALHDVQMKGVPHGLTLGSDDILDYQGDMRHHGTLIGPVVNRISNARAEIDGMVYELERNQDGRIHIHSGADAMHRRLWQVVDHGPDHATLKCELGDGACGLPGNRTITARFSVVAPTTLQLDVEATTDAPTLFNIANHSYWNFDGSDQWDGHTLQIAADRYLPTNPDNTPTGEIADVTGTDMDFRAPRAITQGSPAMDHNFCLADGSREVEHILTLTGTSGVGMRMSTDQPGVQLYDGRNAKRPGRTDYEGIAIEAQFWPDAPNHSGFPSINAAPDRPYSQTTRFEFFTPQT